MNRGGSGCWRGSGWDNAYVDNFHIFDHSIREGEGEDYLHLGGGDVSIHRSVVHRVQQPKVRFCALRVCSNLKEMRLRSWLNSDRQELTAFLEDIQTNMCDVVVSYVSVVFSFLAERPDEDGVVLRGDEGDSVEIDESRHGHGFDDDPAGITLVDIETQATRPASADNLNGPTLYSLRRFAERKKENIEKQ